MSEKTAAWKKLANSSVTTENSVAFASALWDAADAVEKLELLINNPCSACRSERDRANERAVSAEASLATAKSLSVERFKSLEAVFRESSRQLAESVIRENRLKECLRLLLEALGSKLMRSHEKKLVEDITKVLNEGSDGDCD